MDVEYLITYESLFIAMITQVHFSVHGIQLGIIILPEKDGYHLCVGQNQLKDAEQLFDDWEQTFNPSLIQAYTNVLLEKRVTCKKLKNYQEADLIRMALKEIDFKIIDIKEGYNLEVIEKNKDM